MKISMPTFTNPFVAQPRGATGPEPPTWKATPDSKLKLRIMSSGGIVGPGRVISKAERDDLKSKRVDSVADIDPEEEQKRQEEYERSWTALSDKVSVSLDPHLRRIGNSMDVRWAPNACAGTVNLYRDRRRTANLRHLIVFIILLLIVFGVLYTLVEYLLLATRASACSVSTIYVPFTVTVTAGPSDSSSTPLVAPQSASTSITKVSNTSTSTRTVTSFVTLGTSTERPPYVYTVDPSGSTRWVNGISPSSGVSLVTETTSVLVSPTPSTGLATLDTTTLSVEYLTAPSYTTTEYTFSGPATTITSTSTSTSFVTYTLSYASPGSTDSRSAFPGISSAGWNSSTSSILSASSAIASSVAPESAAYTSVYYTPSGSPTTSTTTTLLTTTISRRLTVTIIQSSSAENPGAIASSSSGSSGWPSTLSSIATTHNGTIVGPETASTSSSSLSMTTLPIPSSLPTLTTISASNSQSAFSTPAASSLTMPTTPLSTPAVSSSSAAGAISGSSSLTTSTYSNSSSIASASSIVASSSESAQITTTMSTYPGSSMSSFSVANSWTSMSSGSTSGRSSSKTAAKPSSGSTPSSDSSRVAPASASSSGIITGSQTSSSTVETSVSIYSTLSGSVTISSRSTVGPVGGSSSPTTSGLTSSTSPSSTIPSSTQPIESTSSSSESPQSSALSQSHTRHHHHSPTASGSRTMSSTQSGSSAAPTSEASTSASHPGSTESSVAASTPSHTGHTHVGSASSGSSSGASGTTPATPSTLSSYTRTTTLTEPTSSFSDTASASPATATPTGGCGEHGDFLVNFDNLPNFTPTDQNNSDITQAPPIENPYWHLTWSDGYVYAPQPHEPYSPVSPPHLAVFLADGTGKRVGSSPSGNYSKPGEISDGPREAISAFWFDAYSAWFGCDNRGPSACTLTFSAYSWSPQEKTEVLLDQTSTTIQPCENSRGCGLSLVEFPATFRSLSGLQVQAFVGNDERMFFMDDLSLHWTNNTCAAGLLRQSSL